MEHNDYKALLVAANLVRYKGGEFMIMLDKWKSFCAPCHAHPCPLHRPPALSPSPSPTSLTKENATASALGGAGRCNRGGSCRRGRPNALLHPPLLFEATASRAADIIIGTIAPDACPPLVLVDDLNITHQQCKESPSLCLPACHAMHGVCNPFPPSLW